MAQKKLSAPAKRSSKPRKKPESIVDLAVRTIPDEGDVARRAYSLWEQRGRPMGSPEQDWYQAKEELQAGV